VDLLKQLKKALAVQDAKISKGVGLKYEQKAAMSEAQAHRMWRVDMLRARTEFLLNIQQPFDIDLKPHRRQKRFVFTLIALAIAAAAATAFGVYTVHELNDMNNRAKSLEHVTKTAFNYVDNEASRIDLLAGMINGTSAQAYDNAIRAEHATASTREDTTILMAESMVRDIESIITAALDKRLHPAAIEERNTNEIVKALHAESEKKGFTPMVTRTADLLQCRTSFLMDAEGITLLVHVPTAPKNAFLELYRFIPLPIPVHEKYHALVNTAETIIAISDDDSVFRTFTPQELTECDKVGFFFACDKANVVRKRPTEVSELKDDGMCLFSLFLQKYDDATRACNFNLKEAPPTVEQVSQTHFVTFNGNQHQGRIRCPKSSRPSKHRSTFSANFISEIDLNPGCIAETNTHIFAAPDNGKIRDWTVKYDIPPMTLNIGSGLDLDELHQQRQTGISKLANMSTFTVDEATRAWREAQDSGPLTDLSTSHHVTLSITAAILGAIGIIIITIFLCCLVNRNTRAKAGAKQPTTLVVTNHNMTPSAPNMAMMPPPHNMTSKFF
jgi:hypothetical protein